jgi:hypothetical protein
MFGFAPPAAGRYLLVLPLMIALVFALAAPAAANRAPTEAEKRAITNVANRWLSASVVFGGPTAHITDVRVSTVKDPGVGWARANALAANQGVPMLFVRFKPRGRWLVSEWGGAACRGARREVIWDLRRGGDWC